MEQPLFPPQRTETERWCRKGRHWVETAGDKRQWQGYRCPDCRNAVTKQSRQDNPERWAGYAANNYERVKDRMACPLG